MSNTNEVGTEIVEFSLSQLAGMDTSEYAVVTSRLPMAGLWKVLCTEAKLAIQDGSEQNPQPLPYYQYKFESIVIDPLVKGPDFDPETTTGKGLSERVTLWPKDFATEVGLLKGRYKRVGLPTDGVLGGTEEVKGWIDGAVGHYFILKVRHYTAKNGSEQAGIDWVGPMEEIGSSDA